MCGIAGFIDSRGVPGDAHRTINRMLSAIRYRGPDEIGCRIDNHAALGSVRLSIIDLVSGQQPMASTDKRYWLCFNGEIFNYKELRQKLTAVGRRFVSSSDTEVLLQALIEWGETAISYLDGQFSFALYDQQQKSLLIARDRFGERPLFYAQRGDAFIFGSEIKALMQHPAIERRLSAASVGDIFHLWTDLPGATAFAGIHSLPKGHFLRYQAGAIQIEPYYKLPLGQPLSGITFDEAVAEVRHRLTEGVRLRLRSDVPIGVYLSGGLDSTITTALVRQQINGRLNSYSITFEDAEFDESKYQIEAAELYGTEHHAIKVTNKDIVDVFPEIVRHAETPLFRSAPAPMFLLARAVAGTGLKVVMTGEGADEAFLGYDIFKETLFRHQFDQFKSDDERRAAVARLYPYMAGLRGGGQESLLRSLAAQTDNRDDPLFSHRARFGMGQFAERLLVEPSHDAEPRLLEELVDLYPGLASASPVGKAQVLEYETLLEGYLLSSQGDRMTTAHGVEARCAFLDHGLVDFAFSLPEEFKLKDGVNEKYLLKAAFADLVPPSIVSRPKQPYRAPDCRAFLQHAGEDWIAAAISPERVKASGLFKPDVVERFIGRLKTLPPAAISPREDQAFMLLMSTLLLKSQFVDNFSMAELTDVGTFAVFEDQRR